MHTRSSTPSSCTAPPWVPTSPAISGCRKVMDFGDADSEKWLEYAETSPPPVSWAFRLEGKRVRAAERRLGAQFDAGSVNAPRERDVLAGYVRSPITVIPNGVDLEYFQPGPIVRPAATSRTGSSSPATCPTGPMWTPSATSSAEILPQDPPGDTRRPVLHRGHGSLRRRPAPGGWRPRRGHRPGGRRPALLRLRRGRRRAAARCPRPAEQGAGGHGHARPRGGQPGGLRRHQRRGRARSARCRPIRRSSAAPSSPCFAIPPPASALPRPAARASKQTTTGASSSSGSKTWWPAAISSPQGPPGRHYTEGRHRPMERERLLIIEDDEDIRTQLTVRPAGRVRRLRGGRPRPGRGRCPAGSAGDRDARPRVAAQPGHGRRRAPRPRGDPRRQPRTPR